MTNWLSLLELCAIAATAMAGAFGAVRAAKLDLVGVLSLGMLTALGGGIMRDLLIGVTPPASFVNINYLIVAAFGALLPMFVTAPRPPLRRVIGLLDAVGLGLYSVVGAEKALLFSLDPLAAVIVGVVGGVGGGVVRDILVGRVPEVLHAGFTATPAAVGALFVVFAYAMGWGGVIPTLGGAALCFTLRVLGIYFKFELPSSKAHRASEADRLESTGLPADD